MAFRFCSLFLISLSLAPILLGICVVRAANSREKHSAGYCAMYDICGQRSDGKVLNCPYGSPSVKPDALFSSKVQSLCPTITGNVCCTEGQFDTLRTQVQQAVPLLVGCPACLRNFLNLFCEMSCSPNQSLFINVTSSKKVSGNLTVDAIDFHVTDAFGEGLYSSCKDVKFGTLNTLAINFVAGGAQNFTDWFAFLGRQAGHNEPGSPYAINFNSNAAEASGVKPMNVSTYSCGDTSLGCSCDDCPSSPTCSNSAPPASHKGGSCRLRIGSLHAKCIDVALPAVYIALIFLFFGWGYTHQKKRTDPASRTNPVMNVTNNEDIHVNRKSRSVPMLVCNMSSCNQFMFRNEYGREQQQLNYATGLYMLRD